MLKTARLPVVGCAGWWRQGAAGARKLKQQTEARRCGSARTEYAVPVVLLANHAVTQTICSHGKLDGHGRHVFRCCVFFEKLASIREDIVDDRRVNQARQKVCPDHPLVVLDYEFACLLKQVGAGSGRCDLVHHAVVKPDHGQMRLRNDQVFVVAMIGNECGTPLHLERTLPHTRQVVAITRPQRDTRIEQIG